MLTRAQIKANARKALGGNLFGEKWMLALVICLVYSLVLGAASYTFLGVLILYGPLTIGLNAAMLAASRESRAVDIGEMFKNGFSSDFGRALLVGLMKTIFLMLWSFLFCIPGIIKTYSYALAETIAYDRPELSWRECIDESRRLMNGHKFELFIQDLSFIGWFFVGALCLGVGSLWVTPYYMQSRIEFYRALTDDYNVVDASYTEMYEV